MQTPTSIENQRKYDAKTDALVRAVQTARAALREAEHKLAQHLHLDK